MIKEVLINKQYQFGKGSFIRILGTLFGFKNLLIVEGEEWKVQVMINHFFKIYITIKFLYY